MTEGQLSEYETLREEILQSDRLTVEVTSIVFAATGLIIAQGIAKGGAATCLIPLPLLLMAYAYAASKRWGIWSIAGYCRRHLETMDGVMWQTRLVGLRSRCGRMEGSKRWWVSALLTEYLMFMFMGLGSAACSAFAR